MHKNCSQHVWQYLTLSYAESISRS